MFLKLDVKDNMTVVNRRELATKFGVISERQLRAKAQKYVRNLAIKTPGLSQISSFLSGGNQQKTILARELSRPLRALVASQPTRGLDVGSIEFIHSRIVEERDKGTAVLVVSTELDEVTSLADRIAVMYRGRIVGIVDPDTPRDVLGLMMAGVPLEDARAEAKAHPTTIEEAAE